MRAVVVQHVPFEGPYAIADALRRHDVTIDVRLAGAEIGWGPVRLLPDAKADLLLRELDGELTVLHWHGDTVVLPREAELLASSDRYANQAFRVAPRAWGLQFHIEVTLAAVVGYVEAFGGDAAIAEQAPRHLAALETTRDEILDRFAALI